MTLRKEVFQSKVLQKLYPAVPKQEKEHSPPRIVDALSRKPHVKRKVSAIGDAGTVQSAANPGRRMYTVLPPPADYKADTEKSVAPHLLESTNPAEESVHDSDQEEEGEEQKRKRKRRKRKPTHLQDCVVESSPGVSQTPVGEGEHISRNRKRKLKKKRHKEKLLAMGLMPRASALEFTYRRDGEEEEEEEEEEEDDERRAAEVSDFLRTTMEIYLSDSSHVEELPLLSGTVNDLLSSITRGHHPTSVLKQLYRLKAFVQRQQTDKLEEALQELCTTSAMSAEETTAVASLFQYWITAIFPMQGDKKTEFSALHP